METPSKPTSIVHRIREGLDRVAVALRTDDWHRAKAIGLNPTQLAILELLEGRPSGLGVKEIAAHLGVSQPTATDSIAALVRKGALSKRAGGSDRRSVTVGITPKGLILVDDRGDPGHGDRALSLLTSSDQEDLLLALVKMIRHLQQIGAIPIQRMCVSCRYFAPFAHAGAARPHHCQFVNAPFGQRDIRVDCRDHETADSAHRAAAWDAFQSGSAPIPPDN